MPINNILFVAPINYADRWQISGRKFMNLGKELKIIIHYWRASFSKLKANANFVLWGFYCFYCLFLVLCIILLFSNSWGLFTVWPFLRSDAAAFISTPSSFMSLFWESFFLFLSERKLRRPNRSLLPLFSRQFYWVISFAVAHRKEFFPSQRNSFAAW